MFVHHFEFSLRTADLAARLVLSCAHDLPPGEDLAPFFFTGNSYIVFPNYNIVKYEVFLQVPSSQKRQRNQLNRVLLGTLFFGCIVSFVVCNRCLQEGTEIWKNGQFKN